ncbi:4-hydroxythreonine-4-phosphate dehydrogenase 1 [Moraxella cuniculi]|uniref:4-hydroxythreonine-4-phosphate dehydrogenase 1 n=2 Tax=Moraxella cuniculi TaxID=34061 RepID=A0A448GXS4_9GAMM|nr:4-hydroxythreonine-4-phosphate dehydrogenase 1 [Moraxella cuniculi]
MSAVYQNLPKSPLCQTALSQKKPLLITTGEPAGIGMDIVLDILPKLTGRWLIAADATALYERAKQLKTAGVIDRLPAWSIIDVPDEIEQLPAAWLEQSDCPSKISHETGDDLFYPSQSSDVVILSIACHEKVKPSKLNPANAIMVEKQLRLAHRLAMANQVAAIITAPIQKSVMIDAGILLDNGTPFSGHTEYFMHKAACDKVVMMLANAAMKVALVTTHLPLRQVADAINFDEIIKTVQITHQALVEKFAIAKPKILVCGLNPHAGEQGHLGDEELTVINPALAQMQAAGIDVSFAMSADTLFTKPHLGSCDAVIAMYHDQGLAPLKSHGFGDTVNITLGLPYVRTSVDHGTALDLAGRGGASSSSLWQAINYAQKMTAG